MSEAERQARITDALSMFGFLWQHVRPSVDVGRGKGWRTAISGDKGSPDLLAVHPERGQLLLIEVKADKGRLTAEQQAWGTALRAALNQQGSLSPGYWVCDSDESERALIALISGGRVR